MRKTTKAKAKRSKLLRPEGPWPYFEGKDAHAAGKSANDNPHTSQSERDDWAQGWHEAEALRLAARRRSAQAAAGR